MSEAGKAHTRPLVVCAFGWGQVFQLYHDHLDVHGKYYALCDLTSIQPTYHHGVGLPSARLELRFGDQKLVLRGIAAIADAQKVVEYLKPWCEANKAARVTDPAILPIIRVPVCLPAGEHAHYSTSASLCGERMGESARYGYPAQDHGMLIFTNRRVIYMGRNKQLLLDYHRLLHISRLHTAIAFQADCLSRRVIFAVPQPVECALYIDAILQHFEQQEASQPRVGERIGSRK